MKHLKSLFVLLLASNAAVASSPNEHDQRMQENSEKWRGSEWNDAQWKSWPTVGKARLNWLFFGIYQSELTSPTGRYIQNTDITPHPLALSIVYQRNITKTQLLEATADQWQNLGYDSALQQQWLDVLDGIFTDVQEGERLVYITDGEAGEFRFYGKNRTDITLGRIDKEQLNDAFLSIWLSENTEYPKHRARLIGMK